MKIGLALSGGAARGIAHIGVLKCLEENGIKPYMMCGTSAGSIVSALYCAGMSTKALEEVVDSVNWKDIVRPTLPRMGLVKSENLEQFINSLIGPICFNQLKIPLLITAVDLCCGEEVILEEGNVAKAVRASCSIPGIFTPVRIGDQLLVDGGLLNNVPIRPLREYDLDSIIAVDLNAQRPLIKEPQNIFDVLLQSFYIMQRDQDQRSYRYADLLIKPDLGDIPVWDISAAPLFINRGYQACQAGLAEYRPRKKKTSWLQRLGIRAGA